MSWRASAYVKDLVVCPNGEPITRAEKLVLFVLADYHQDKMGAYTYPSILQIAPKALCTKDTCSDALASLEDKGVLECVKPARQGRGQVTYYVFLELDKVDEKGVEIPPFFSDERVEKGRKKGGKSGAAYKEEREHERSKNNNPPNPPNGGSVSFKNEESDARKETTGAEDLAKDVPTDDAAAPGNRDFQSDRDRSDPGSRSDVSPTAQKILEQICSALGIARRRLRREILEAVVLEMAQKSEHGEIAKNMIDSYRVYLASAHLFRCTPAGAAKFFATGLWRDQRGWPWDEQKRMREEILQPARSSSPEADERESFEMWQSMPETFKRENPTWFEGKKYGGISEACR